MKDQTTVQTAANAIAVTALYKVAFNRLPDAEGLAYWLNQMDNGNTLRDVARGFSTHLPQFGTGKVASTVDALVMNATGHAASAPAVEHWGILAINAVPSYELAYELTLQLVGQPLDPWAVPLV